MAIKLNLKRIFGLDKTLINPEDFTPLNDASFVTDKSSDSEPKRVLGSELKSWFLSLFATNVNKLFNRTTESFSGLANYQNVANEEFVSFGNSLQNQIRQIAGASATFVASSPPVVINTVETLLAIDEYITSTNPDFIEIDALNNHLIIKEPGIYQFSTFINISNFAPIANKALTLTTRDVSDESIITQRSLVIPAAGYSGTSTFSFEILEAQTPLTISFHLQGSQTGMQLQELQTTTLTGTQTTSVGGAVSIAEATNAAIRAIKSYSEGANCFNQNNGKLYAFNSASTAADDDDTVLKPNNIDTLNPGRWLLVQTFALDTGGNTSPTIHLTGNYTTPLFSDTSPDPSFFLQEINLGSVDNFSNTEEVVVAFPPISATDELILARRYNTYILTIYSDGSPSGFLNAVCNNVLITNNAWSGVQLNQVAQLIVSKDRGNSAKNMSRGYAQIDGTTNIPFYFAKDSPNYNTENETFIGNAAFGIANLCITKIYLTESASDLILNIEYANYTGLAVVSQTSFKVAAIG